MANSKVEIINFAANAAIFTLIPAMPTIWALRERKPKSKWIPLAALDTMRFVMYHYHWFVTPENEVLVRIMGSIGYAVLGFAEYLYMVDSSS